MAEQQWVVTCRIGDDINYRQEYPSKATAEQAAEKFNAAPHCSLDHVAEALEVVRG